MARVVAAALMTFGLSCLASSSSTTASASMTRGGGGASAPAEAPITESAGAFAPPATGGDGNVFAEDPARPAAVDPLAFTIDPERILRQDFRIAPKLSSVAPADSVLATIPADDHPSMNSTATVPASTDSDRPADSLVVPLPAIGAGWALLIGAGMYQFGSRAMRLRR